jgi:tetratricopeptide (TPR) repeat protein
VIVLGARTLRHAWAKGESTPLADITLSAGSLWEGMRSALLSYAALEQPWSAIGRALMDPRQPWGMLLAALAGVLLLTLLGSRFPDRPRQRADRMLTLGALWAVFGALPVALAGHHYSAYYITFSGVGFALLLGRLLSGAPAGLVFATLATSTVLGLAANRVDLFNFARMEPVAGVSFITATRLDFERVFLDSLHVALERIRPPRGAAVYISYAPRYTTFVTMYGRAPRVWFDDPHLDLMMIGEYHPPESRPHAFLRFDSARRGFMQVPNPLMEAQLAAEAAMDGRRPAEARVQLERALALLPPTGLEAVHLDLLNNRGFAYAALGDTAAARESWREALALDPTFESAALNLARYDAEAGRLGAARETLERLLAAAPTADDAFSLLVRVQLAQGDLAAATRTLARLSAVNPAMAAALEGQGTTPRAGTNTPR